jgi:hypothetical protein
MPILKEALPKYRKHKASGQAVVTIQGQDFYLGLTMELHGESRRIRPRHR